MDQFIKMSIAIGGAVLSYMFGGAFPLLGALLFFTVLDYVTGFTASWLEGKLSSKVGMKGIPKKVLIFVIVAVAHQIDTMIGGDGHFFRDATIFFYITNELISIIENSGRIGLPVPAVIKKAVEVLKDKGDAK
jgi:toxin secretion/phage lysis holin